MLENAVNRSETMQVREQCYIKVVSSSSSSLSSSSSSRARSCRAREFLAEPLIYAQVHDGFGHV